MNWIPLVLLNMSTPALQNHVLHSRMIPFNHTPGDVPALLKLWLSTASRISQILTIPCHSLRLWLLTSAPADLFIYLHCALGTKTSRSSFHSQEGPHLLSPLPSLLPQVGSFLSFRSGLNIPWLLSHYLVLSTDFNCLHSICYVFKKKKKKNKNSLYLSVSASFPSRRGLVCLVHHRLQRRGQNRHTVGAQTFLER